MKRTNSIQHFTDLHVWQDSHRLFLDLCDDVDAFPATRSARIIADQSLRSSGSISTNIAEGFNRSCRKFLNSLDIALGETNETESWLYKVRDRGFVDGEVIAERIATCKSIGRMLNALIRKIKARPPSACES